MSYASTFIAKGTKVLEQRNTSFYLSEPVPGVSFTDEEPRVLRAGRYVVVEPDSRDNRRMIVVNVKNNRMYAVNRRMIPSPNEDGGR